MNVEKELEVIYELRSVLIEIYPESEKSDKYIIASELLTDLETYVRNRDKEFEDETKED